MGSSLHHPRALRIGAAGRAAAVTFAVLATVTLVATPAAAKSDEVTRAPSGITYVTGGAGSEAVDRLKSMEREFNLKLVFANTAGEFLSDVKVTIVDASGSVVLDTTSEGPLLLAKLAPGGYRVEATFHGRAESRKVSVGGAKLMTLDFRWASG